ncbi:glycosyltransferase family 2 protein [Pseudonocardia sp. H11422]|uniref:glycosyltransferase family 2 protein n=1 Tax=Pseudonocardia sp. H11422 TaxID=2835866 RepID=UPI001BDC3676|nr:glycosyltransferase [Pseudonocardia sp. H11422]
MTVDILFPYYGDVGLMQQAVRSVLNQQDPDWTLTVVDDGYPDSAVGEWFATIDDPRVRYLRNESNLGANGNYRKCLTFVEHDWFVVMGADDLMLPNYLRAVADARRAAPNAAIIQPGVQVIDEHSVPSRPLVDRTKGWYSPRGQGRRVLSGEPLAASLLRGNWLYFPSLCWRADALPASGFRPGLNVVQDLALALDVITAGGSMIVDDTVCFQYRRHSASDSSWRALEGTRFDEERRFFLDMARQMDDRGWSRAARVARWHLSSRLNAASLLPLAVRKGHRSGVRNLSRHLLTGFR